jgi:Flp pilus assembly protein TadG
MRVSGRLRGRSAGTTTVEFAMTATPMLMLVLGVLQAGLMLWTWQALEATAIDAARCAAINATSCQNVATSVTATRSYAVSIAQLRGLGSVTTGNVTVQTGAAAQTACGSTTASVVSVTLSYTYKIVFVSLPSSLTAAACFPLASG